MIFSNPSVALVPRSNSIEVTLKTWILRWMHEKQTSMRWLLRAIWVSTTPVENSPSDFQGFGMLQYIRDGFDKATSLNTLRNLPKRLFVSIVLWWGSPTHCLHLVDVPMKLQRWRRILSDSPTGRVAISLADMAKSRFQTKQERRTNHMALWP